ncbi:hypothetical protein H2509_18365 [Stappia sp. F7233]|uniref:Antitoxin n=1 Tax=Stappia albiluteola TaxID=2758565 RepID=A0A839AJ88_9HYPH|nr:hypothetical protein [Stappia albiluteola]MBA5779098.1 hypothetical protein [Stappia albiluteola]
MADATTISATEFARGFARIQEDVREYGVIKVTSHNRVVGGFLSPKEMENYERLKRREREILKAGQLPDDLVAELEASRDLHGE